MMTYREMLTAIVSGDLNEDVIEKAHERLERLDAENEKRKNRVSKKAAMAFGSSNYRKTGKGVQKGYTLA